MPATGPRTAPLFLQALRVGRAVAETICGRQARSTGQCDAWARAGRSAICRALRAQVRRRRDRRRLRMRDLDYQAMLQVAVAEARQIMGSFCVAANESVCP